MDNKFVTGKGITVTTNFDISTALPIDSRTVVYTVDDLREMSPDIVYEGLLVFVKDGEDGNKLYQWKKNLNEDGVLSEDYSWGPIEAEVSTRDIIEIMEQIDFENMKTLMMQRNKKDFFPMGHENFIFVDKEGKTLSDKYQTIYDETLPADSDKTIVGSINKLDTKMEETLAEFREEIATTLQKLKDDVAQMQQDVQATMDQLEADIIAEMDALQKDLEDMIAAKQKEMEDIIAAMEKEMEDKIAFMDSEFERLMNEINAKIATLEKSVEDRVDQMLRDVDNSILSDLQVNNFMEQINANKALLQL